MTRFVLLDFIPAISYGFALLRRVRCVRKYWLLTDFVFHFALDHRTRYLGNAPVAGVYLECEQKGVQSRGAKYYLAEECCVYVCESICLPDFCSVIIR